MNKKEKNKKRRIGELSLIFTHLCKYKTYLITSVILVIVTAGLSMVFPYFMGELIGKSFLSGQFAEASGNLSNIDIGQIETKISKYVLIIILVLTIQAVLAFFRIKWFNLAAELALVDIRKKIFRNILTMPMSYFGKNSAGKLASSFSADLNLLRDTIITALPQLLRQSLILIMSLTFALIASAKLTLIMLASIPFVIIISFFIGKKVKKNSKQSQERLSESNAKVSEAIDLIKIVKAFRGEARASYEYSNFTDSYIKNIKKEIGMRALMVSFIIFALFGIITVVIWLGAKMLANGDITPEDFIRFILFSIFISGAIASLPDAISMIFKALGACTNLNKILHEEPEFDFPDEVPKTKKSVVKSSSVSFNDVSFAYEEGQENVIKGISFVIAPNSRVALVGESGAGKTTLMYLLLGLYKINDGDIVINNKSISELSLPELRSMISVVPQEASLFSISVLDNIKYGNQNASDAEAISAAKKAQAHDFIEKLPDKYQSVIGDKGSKLSAGQRQRIAIARAFLADTPILILDEATSALDAENEAEIQKAIEILMRERTCIIIAHRLATIRKADNIIVLRDGKIVETGKHDDLIKKQNGYYNILAKLQFVK